MGWDNLEVIKTSEDGQQQEEAGSSGKAGTTEERQEMFKALTSYIGKDVQSLVRWRTVLQYRTASQQDIVSNSIILVCALQSFRPLHYMENLVLIVPSFCESICTDDCIDVCPGMDYGASLLSSENGRDHGVYFSTR